MTPSSFPKYEISNKPRAVHIGQPVLCPLLFCVSASGLVRPRGDEKFGEFAAWTDLEQAQTEKFRFPAVRMVSFLQLVAECCFRLRLGLRGLPKNTHHLGRC